MSANFLNLTLRKTFWPPCHEIELFFLEPVCCKKRQKSPNQETEGYEWYQIGPKWAWVTPLIIEDQFGNTQSL